MRLTAPQAWDFWRSTLGSPRYVLAPMVNQSELHFRLLTRAHGTDLTYSPMYHARLFHTDKKYRERIHPIVKLSEEHEKLNRPLVGQLCGHKGEDLVAAGRLLQDTVDAIDLNCGCPQGIARRGQYGAYLLTQPDTIVDLVEAMVNGLDVPVFVKLRILPGRDEKPSKKPRVAAEQDTCRPPLVEEGDVEGTLALMKRLEALGVAGICLHGRTASNKGQDIAGADWGVIKRAVGELEIPVIANGSVETRAEADACLAATGAAAVMSGEALLENPALFKADQPGDLDDLMQELCALYEQYPVPDLSCLKAHLWHSLYKGFVDHPELREALANAHSVEEMRAAAAKMKEVRKATPSADKLGWYRRHRKTR